MYRLLPRRAIFLLALCTSSVTFIPASRMAAEKAPHAVNLTLHDLNGKRVSLRDLRGKLVVLNLWATWCEPCNAEMPLLVEAAQKYQKQGVVFIGASLDDAQTQGKIPAFLDKYHVTYTILTGTTADDLKRLGMGIAVPGTAFIDANGVIRARILGQMRPQELQDRVDWMLRGEAGSAPPALVTHLDNLDKK